MSRNELGCSVVIESMNNTLATPPENINLADYAEIKTVGNVRAGDIMVRDCHLMLVTKVTRTAKTIGFRAENGSPDAPTGYGQRVWISKHRSTTKVDKALGSFTHIYRKAVSA